MGQGNDRGTQYRSGVYWLDDEQRALAEASKAAYETVLGGSAKITTGLRPASDFAACFFYAKGRPDAIRVVVSALPRAPCAEAFGSLLEEERADASLRHPLAERAVRALARARSRANRGPATGEC